MELSDIHEMQKIDQTSNTIGEWKRSLKTYVEKFGLEDLEVIELARSWKLPYIEAKELFNKYL